MNTQTPIEAAQQASPTESANKTKAPITAAQVLVQVLRDNGTNRAFCVPGESYLPVLDALYDAHHDIELITCRQEGGAAFMAEAYGKLTGRPGICFVTRGPGATNASIGVHTAFQDSTPMILFIGQVARDQYDREAFQEVDFRAMFSPMAKWVAQIDSADRMAEYISRAFHVALSGRPGPVVLALPEDMLSEPAPYNTPYEGPAPATAPVYEPPASQLEELAACLRSAKKPVVILGGSGWTEQATHHIRSFVEAHDLPVACAFRFQHLYDNRLPNYIGDVGIGINPALAGRIKTADLVLAIGPRLGEMTTSGYSLFDIPFPKQKLIHIHQDANEIGRVYRPHLGIAATMPEIAKALTLLTPESTPAWTLETVAARHSYEAWSTPLNNEGAVNLGDIYQTLSRELPDDAILTNGAGNYSAWLHRFYRYPGYTSQLAPTNGAMGYGLPAAVAAKASARDRPVICFAGDGCFMMNGQELATAMQHDLPIVILVFNNSMYGTIRMHQERHYPDRTVGTDLLNPDFVTLAKAYGASAERVEKTADFEPALKRALASNHPSLIEIIVPKHVLAPTCRLS